MKYYSILIVTYGRSGSTLLLGLLNSIDGCTIRGENYNFCRGLYESYLALSKTINEFGVGNDTCNPTSPWYGAVNLDAEQFLVDARNLVMNQLSDRSSGQLPRCIGFKEIRYLDSELKLSADAAPFGISGYLDFLVKLFPNPAMIILTRDHDAVANSAWWKSMDRSIVEQLLTKFEQSLQTYSQDKEWIFHLRYEDMVGKTERLRGMYEFLGASYDDQVISHVLSTSHSFRHSSVDDEHKS